jgi:predicted dehydrogenase
MPNKTKKSLNIAIIGAGNIGAKRAQAIVELKTDKLVWVYDINQEKAKALAEMYGASPAESLGQILKDESIDCLVIATTTDISLTLTLKGISAKKHILVEKPLASNSKDAAKVSLMAAKFKSIVKVGFNHRHHPALSKAHELFAAGKIGKILYIRSIYGHGARPGYDTEWRMQKKFSPGGELFDQGVHIIDLAYWFLGKFSGAFAINKNLYWKKSQLEDNSFSQLQTKTGANVFFQVSLTQWKNRFNFEVYGDKGYLVVNGLGKSYGVETLICGADVGQGRSPKEEVFEFIGDDISWREEWLEFRSAVLESRQPLASAKDNIEVNKALEALYRSSQSGKIIKIKP